MPKLIKIKGDASFRSFFRKKVNGRSSIVVYAKKEKFKNLLVYDAVNKILSKNNILVPRLHTQRYDKNFIEIEDFGNETIFKILKKKGKNKLSYFNQIIKFIAMISPFSDIEKQVLLETKNLSDFYKKLQSILELEIVEDNNNQTIN